MRYQPLNPEIFIKNRQRFTREMKPISIAIFVSNDEVPVNGDALIHLNRIVTCFGLVVLCRKIAW
jgi:Xaa-Pro aminopeptidase